MRIVTAVVLLPVMLAACGFAEGKHDGHAVASSGSGASRSFAATNFTGVDLRGPDDVQVRVGPAFSVRAEGPSDQLDKLDIRVDGSTLRVGRQGNSFNWGSRDGKGVKVFVTLPRLTLATVTGSGDLDADRGEGDFSGAIAGSGNLRIGELRATNANLSIAGSGDLGTAGTADKLSLSIAGSGDIDAAGLSAKSADVSIAGSGSAKAAVHGAASVSIVGSGDVDLGGGAQCSVSKVGSGDAHCS